MQGGLIDLRFGQSSVEVDGRGVLLDYDGTSSFTLNGKSSSAEELAKLVKEGLPLTVAVRYDERLGKIGWMDAFSPSLPVKAIRMRLEPNLGPAYQPGQTVRIRVSPRPGPGAFLLIPGVTRRLPLKRGRASLELLEGWNWRELPIFVVSGEEIRSGRRLSVASETLQVTGVGPEVASQRLTRFPCWVEYSGPSYLMDRVATKITASDGAKIQDVQFRRGRLNFWLEVDGVGTYELNVNLVDQLGRESSRSWVVRAVR